MLLFAASANVGYRVFTYANEKFTNVFVRACTKFRCHRVSLW